VYSEVTKGVFRRYQRGIQKIPKGYSEDTKGIFRSRKSKDRKYDCQKKKDKTKIYKTLLRKLKIEQEEPH
jgi:hypothetical protein